MNKATTTKKVRKIQIVIKMGLLIVMIMKLYILFYYYFFFLTQDRQY